MIAGFAGKASLVGLVLLAFDDLYATIEGDDSILRDFIDGMGEAGDTAILVDQLKMSFAGLGNYISGTLWPIFQDIWTMITAGIAEVMIGVEKIAGKIQRIMGAIQGVKVEGTRSDLEADADARQAGVRQLLVNAYDKHHGIQTPTRVGAPGNPLDLDAMPAPAPIHIVQHISGAGDPKAVGTEAGARAGHAVDAANRRRKYGAIPGGA